MSDRNIQLSPAAARKLADAITRRRIEMGHRSARALGLDTGLDYRTITNLEACRRDNVSRTTLGTLELHLNWPAGYLNSLLESADRPTAAREVSLQVPEGASDVDVESALAVAQATFNATIRQMSGSV